MSLNQGGYASRARPRGEALRAGLHKLLGRVRGRQFRASSLTAPVVNLAPAIDLSVCFLLAAGIGGLAV